jgi:surface carbohydrate biosynthesis protein (TIGR04326 family)
MIILIENPASFIDIKNNDIIFTWNGYEENEFKYSLLKIIESDEDYYKLKYLNWLYKVGEFRIKGKRITDHLTFKDGLSYWWMSILIEKDPWRDNSIMDALRLLAFEKVLKQNKPSQLKIVTNNRVLKNSVKILCNKLGVPFKFEKESLRNSQQHILQKKNYFFLPICIRALISFSLYFKKLFIFHQTTKKNYFSKNSVFFCSYFFNLNMEKLANGYFSSAYWGNIFDVLKENDLNSNWLQIYNPFNHIPNTKNAIKYIDRINQKKNIQGLHFLLEEKLDFKIILSSILKYIFLFRKFYLLQNIRTVFTPGDSEADFWPIMKDSWKESLIGSTAVSNLFYIELFDKLFASVPFQKKGFFLYENQSWEKAMIHSWRKYNHGNIIAVAHSTVRYWDLRYFTDNNTLNDISKNAMPQADYVALNGIVAKKSYASTGFPSKKILECEAIRYLGLSDVKFRINKIKTGIHNPTKILLLGDYTEDGRINLL